MMHVCMMHIYIYSPWSLILMHVCVILISMILHPDACMYDACKKWGLTNGGTNRQLNFRNRIIHKLPGIMVSEYWHISILGQKYGIWDQLWRKDEVKWLLNVSARKCRHIKCENRVTLLKKKTRQYSISFMLYLQYFLLSFQRCPMRLQDLTQAEMTSMNNYI